MRKWPPSHRLRPRLLLGAGIVVALAWFTRAGTAPHGDASL